MNMKRFFVLQPWTTIKGTTSYVDPIVQPQARCADAEQGDLDDHHGRGYRGERVLHDGRRGDQPVPTLHALEAGPLRLRRRLVHEFQD